MYLLHLYILGRAALLHEHLYVYLSATLGKESLLVKIHASYTVLFISRGVSFGPCPFRISVAQAGFALWGLTMIGATLSSDSSSNEPVPLIYGRGCARVGRSKASNLWPFLLA